jgi:anti-anti-sigma factor
MDQPRPASVLALYGRLVADTVQSLEPMLTGMLIADRPRVVVDLSEVVDCDPAGAAMLVDAARLARERGGELRIAAPSEAVGPWLHACDIATFATVDGAVEADSLDLLVPASCVDELDAWQGPAQSAFGVRRPLWRVRSARRPRSVRGPVSPRR